MTTSLPRSICWTSPESRSPTRVANSSRMRVRSPSRTRWMIRCFAACTAARPKTAKSMGSSITSPTSKLSSKVFASSREISRLESSTLATTVFKRTMRMSPLPSSMLTSACTLGPYFLARAARMPSWRRAYSSARSSCLVFDTSRNAVRISAELTIQEPLVSITSETPAAPP